MVLNTKKKMVAGATNERTMQHHLLRVKVLFEMNECVQYYTNNELPPKDGANVTIYVFKGRQCVLSLDITYVSKSVATPAVGGSMSVF